MVVRVKLTALRETSWHEYLIRFVLGGAATALTGFIAKNFGPETGGLFLAFPAIFVASTTLIEMHERKRKERAGLQGSRRGREAAALDASGAALGSLALLVFAILVWRLPHSWGALALVAAFAAWAAIAVFLWFIRRRLRCLV
ncbi:MAG: DUF3147 family protein [Rhizomicrobium sp.]